MTRAFDRTTAAQLVRLRCEIWATAVADADDMPAFAHFDVVEFVPANEPKAPRRHLVASSSKQDINAVVAAMTREPQAKGYDPIRYTRVNITGVVSRVRSNAKAAGFDLSGRFLPPPGSAQFKEIFSPYVALRDKAIADAKQLLQKAQEAAGERARKVVERVMYVH